LLIENYRRANEYSQCNFSSSECVKDFETPKLIN
jgi:hypothetical protein